MRKYLKLGIILIFCWHLVLHHYTEADLTCLGRTHFQTVCSPSVSHWGSRLVVTRKQSHHWQLHCLLTGSSATRKHKVGSREKNPIPFQIVGCCMCVCVWGKSSKRLKLSLLLWFRFVLSQEETCTEQSSWISPVPVEQTKASSFRYRHHRRFQPVTPRKGKKKQIKDVSNSLIKFLL